MNRDHAIGLLDSGVGGLTVVREIFTQLPAERIVYFGDTARMPYGPRPHSEVRDFARQIIRFLTTQDVKLVIVACNSATAAGLPYYQGEYDLPVIGVIEPGVRAAVRHTKTKRIGVIGTQGTIASNAYEQLIKHYAPEVEVFSQACPLFVLLVENELVDTPEALCVAETYLRPLKDAGVDTLILGCTHYPLMSHVIARVMGPEVKLISSAEETAREAHCILQKMDLQQTKTTTGLRHRFFVSGPPAGFVRIGRKLLELEIEAYQVLLP
ncbi:MAG TPA: glutamate racemase [Firmicutes bacterium]|nr:glutamate racemase [Bacillota bacterium]